MLLRIWGQRVRQASIPDDYFCSTMTKSRAVTAYVYEGPLATRWRPYLRGRRPPKRRFLRSRAEYGEGVLPPSCTITETLLGPPPSLVAAKLVMGNQHKKVRFLTVGDPIHMRVPPLALGSKIFFGGMTKSCTVITCIYEGRTRRGSLSSADAPTFQPLLPPPSSSKLYCRCRQ
ncbi:protein of unknown function [Aminobacter niigataensis]|nr:protein of unknown function [Aminobacter niigataensis]